MKHKNDYTAIVFFDAIPPKKWQFVHTIDSFVSLLNAKHSSWKYINIYDRRTNVYLQRVYKGSNIPKFL